MTPQAKTQDQSSLLFARSSRYDQPENIMQPGLERFDPALISEIRDINLHYLMLAQSIIAQGGETAVYRLGLPMRALKVIAALTPSQIMHIANSSSLLFKMRIDDENVWTLLSQYADNAFRHDEVSGTLSRLHASIIQSSQVKESLS